MINLAAGPKKMVANLETTPTVQVRFNSLLGQVAIDPHEVVLLRHKDQRAKKGRTPYELWRDNRPVFDSYQSTQGLDNGPRLKRARHWASFVGTPNGETMFVGLYRVAYRGVLEQDMPQPHADGIDKAGSCEVYDLQANTAFADLAGKLFIEWGDGTRAWIQRAERQDKIIRELRREFQEDAFPGFLNFMASLSKIEALPPGWIAALKSVGGIYLLTCPKTKEWYVGMANGEEGLWQRWVEYARTGHGGNVALKSRDPSDYQVSILAFVGSTVSDAELSEMERLWKRKLQSIEMGLNRNL
jgi:hypothetical protein